MTSATADGGAGPSGITERVLASFAGCPDPRLREIMHSLVGHLHAFVRETGLSEEEWGDGIRFLTAAGQACDERRQELVLLSDTLGVSMLVDALSHDSAPEEATESTVLGPFWAPGAPLRRYGESIAVRPAGQPAWVHGRVTDLHGSPVAGAELDVWQNGEDRLYAVQDASAPEDHLRGRYLARDDGSYAFLGVRPTDYTVPDDGPVGRMLAASGRHPWRPAHVHMRVSAQGFRPLTTHLFDSESRYLGDDTVFAVKGSLVRRFVRRSRDDPDRPPGVDGPWFSVDNDIALAPAPAAATAPGDLQPHRHDHPKEEMR
ncbi:MAG: dioxygenase [Acidimicrobiales bacterium]